MKRKFPPGAVTSVEFLRTLGFSQSSIARCVTSGQLAPEPRARGLYTITGRELSRHHDLMVVALYSPSTTFCLLTALQLLELRAPAPDIWLTISASARMPSFRLLPIIPIRPREAIDRTDVQVMEIDGIKLRYTNAAKTLADCFQFRSKVGLDVAVAALHAARQTGVVTMDEIWRCAVASGVGGVMLPYLEAVG